MLQDCEQRRVHGRREGNGKVRKEQLPVSWLVPSWEDRTSNFKIVCVKLLLLWTLCTPSWCSWERHLTANYCGSQSSAALNVNLIFIKLRLHCVPFAEQPLLIADIKYLTVSFMQQNFTLLATLHRSDRCLWHKPQCYTHNSQRKRISVSWERPSVHHLVSNPWPQAKRVCESSYSVF